MMRVDPLTHYDYVFVEERCSCWVCEDYRRKRDIFQRLYTAVADHHRSCMCAGCKTMRRAHTAERAADERWTLYCEMSYHAAHDPYMGERAMRWIAGELVDPERGDGWWEGRAPYYSLGYWTWRFRMAMARAAMVSGVTGIARAAVQAVSGTLSLAASGA